MGTASVLAAVLANMSVLSISTIFLPFTGLIHENRSGGVWARGQSITVAALVAILCVLAPVESAGLGIDGRFAVIWAVTLLIGWPCGAVLTCVVCLAGWAAGVPDAVAWQVGNLVFAGLAIATATLVETKGRLWAPVGTVWIAAPAGSVLVAGVPALMEGTASGMPGWLASVAGMAAMTLGALLLFRGFLLRGFTEASGREKLEQARRDALDASRVKSEFLMAMSHNFRTPLHGLLGLVEVVEGAMSDGTPKAQLRKAEHLGRQLNHMISTAIRFVEVETVGKISREQRFTLAHLRDKSLNEFGGACRRHGIDLSVSCVGPEQDAARVLQGQQDVIEETTVLVLRFFLRGAPPPAINVTLGLSQAEDGTLSVVITGNDRIGPFTEGKCALPGLSDGDPSQSPEVVDLSLAVAARMAAVTGGTLTGCYEPGVGHEFTYHIEVAAV